tara:strand:- start:23937 stop:24767 length:831 start_codon:yes stop_codon:yes gene_type:complete
MPTKTTAMQLIAMGLITTLANADLIGVNYSTGDVFSIDTSTAQSTRIGQTSTGIMGIDRDTSGRIMAITDGIVGKLSVLNEQSWELETVGNLGAGFTSEGGLAVNDIGELFAGTRLAGGGRAIFQIDPDTGSMMQSITLSRSSLDLNGLQFRNDGVLVGIDAIANELVSIDPLSGEMTTITSLSSTNPGAVGGLAIDNGVGYFVTAGTVSGSNGDNSLYSIDLYTGQQQLIGSLGAEAGSGFGIGALTGPAVPTPTSSLLLCMAGACSMKRRSRTR